MSGTSIHCHVKWVTLQDITEYIISNYSNYQQIQPIIYELHKFPGSYLMLKLYMHLYVCREVKTFPILKSQGRKLLDVIFEDNEQFLQLHLH